MTNKIFAIIHGVLTLVVAYRLVVRNDVKFFGILVPCCAAVAVGCWQRRRWLVALGGSLIFLYAFGFVILSFAYDFVLRTQELNFVIFYAILAIILEITSIVVSGKPPKQSGDEDDTDDDGTPIFPGRISRK